MYILHNNNLYKHYTTILLMKKKATSIKIDPELWKKFKLHCIENEVEMSELLEQLIKDKIKSD